MGLELPFSFRKKRSSESALKVQEKRNEGDTAALRKYGKEGARQMLITRDINEELDARTAARKEQEHAAQLQEAHIEIVDGDVLPSFPEHSEN